MDDNLKSNVEPTPEHIRGTDNWVRYGGDVTDVWWTISAFVAIIASLGVYVWQFALPNTRGDLMLVGVACGTVGWVLGILATPYNDHEAARLGRVAALGYAALTGYVIGKLDRVIEAILDSKSDSPVQTWFLPHLAIGTTILLAAAVLTYVTRSYEWTKRGKESQ